MKRLLLSLFFLALAFSGIAQKKGEKIESLKIAFISGQLNLDPGTAEKFWPVYNQYQDELMNLVRERRSLNRDDQRTADEILDQEQKALDLKRKYSAQFLRIINNDQLNTLYRSEKEFRQMLIRRRQQQNEAPRGGMNHSNRPEDRPNRQMGRPAENREAPPVSNPAPQRFERRR
ncbi:MAG: hypothetical protein JNJ58_13615 [Chitinophagaceae bacterium]|nr:hypothetical protein [Chitinophagaceae bacterium]